MAMRRVPSPLMVPGLAVGWHLASLSEQTTVTTASTTTTQTTTTTTTGATTTTTTSGVAKLVGGAETLTTLLTKSLVALVTLLALLTVLILVGRLVRLRLRRQLVVADLVNASGSDELDRRLIGLSQLAREELVRQISRVEQKINASIAETRLPDYSPELDRQPLPSSTPDQGVTKLATSLTAFVGDKAGPAVTLVNEVSLASRWRSPTSPATKSRDRSHYGSPQERAALIRQASLTPRHTPATRRQRRPILRKTIGRRHSLILRHTLPSASGSSRWGCSLTQSPTSSRGCALIRDPRSWRRRWSGP
jgi:hypothetical protein